MRISLVLLAHTDGIDDDVAILYLCTGCHGAQFIGRNYPDAATLHLLKETGGLHIAHEEDAFDRLNICASRNHIDRHRDAGIKAIAKVGENFVRCKLERLHPLSHFRFRTVLVLNLLRNFGEPGSISDLLAEVVSLSEDFTHQADNVVGVGVVFGEDQCLGHFSAIRKTNRDGTVAKVLQHSSNLAFRYYITV